MILSVSRRTDIPAFYSEWFINRIKEGFVYVRNPFNAKQISRVKITPDVVDCIVFWSKDPLPLIRHLEALDKYSYYFQFTITPYDRDIEVNLRNKKEIIDTFIELSKLIGKDRIILRYDPILLSDRYTLDFHMRSFERLCERIATYTERVVISFLDDYKKVGRNLRHINLKRIDNEDIQKIGEQFSKTAEEFNLEIGTCAEPWDLSAYGIKHGRCIDSELIERISGNKLKNLKKDGNRSACLCHECIDIGQYDSCIHGCLYCYANVNKELAIRNNLSHQPLSPILFGSYDEATVKNRKGIKTFRVGNVDKTGQIALSWIRIKDI